MNINTARNVGPAPSIGGLHHVTGNEQGAGLPAPPCAPSAWREL